VEDAAYWKQRLRQDKARVWRHPHTLRQKKQKKVFVLSRVGGPAEVREVLQQGGNGIVLSVGENTMAEYITNDDHPLRDILTMPQLPHVALVALDVDWKIDLRKFQKFVRQTCPHGHFVYLQKSVQRIKSISLRAGEAWGYYRHTLFDGTRLCVPKCYALTSYVNVAPHSPAKQILAEFSSWSELSRALEEGVYGVVVRVAQIEKVRILLRQMQRSLASTSDF
jgi:hypothetical protein